MGDVQRRPAEGEAVRTWNCVATWRPAPSVPSARCPAAQAHGGSRQERQTRRPGPSPSPSRELPPPALLEGDPSSLPQPFISQQGRPRAQGGRGGVRQR